MTRQRLMQKVAPGGKGEVFAQGQIMNEKPVMAKSSTKQKARDRALLMGLGGTRYGS